MDPVFYDTSWTLHALTTSSPSALQSLYDKILATLAARLHQSHTVQRSRKRRAFSSGSYAYGASGDEEEDSETERTGALRTCTWTTTPIFSGEGEIDAGDLDAQKIELVHEKVTHKFILLAQGRRRHQHPEKGIGNDNSQRTDTILVLSKSTPTTFKHVLSFLQGELDTNARNHDTLATPLRLSGTTLQACFHDFIAALAPLSPSSMLSSLHRGDSSDPVEVNVDEILGAIKVTVSFGTVVAQAGLKSLDVDLPANSVKGLLSADRVQKGQRPRTLLALLAAQIEARTGLRLPVAGEQEREAEDDPIMRITKLTCAAFALSGDGRLKFSSKALSAVRGDMRGEKVVGRAQEEMLGRILGTAEQQQQHG